MKILISGSTGLIGSQTSAFLEKEEHRVLRLVRRPPSADNEIAWNPASGTLDKAAIEGVDAVVHLAGESIASGRWTAEKKHRIRESRIQGTRLLAQSLAHLYDPPEVLVSVSAVGYYGDRGEETIDEKSGAGKGFLAELCREWEAATEPAAARGIRVVIPRLGMVLGAGGGALARMLPAFRLGIGGRIGSGRQYMSWISLSDLVGIIHYALTRESLQGPVNAVSPNPCTNSEFSRTLGRVLSRPTLFALPSFAARLAFGEMADEALLSSARVLPARLIESGYSFTFPELESALRHMLQKSVP
jgi:uncharacterized protein (TIGR01777 family)